MKELICIVCPKGCHLQVADDGSTVSGNSCLRGTQYGQSELLDPRRVVTTTVRCTGGAHPRCPVKTDRAVPKALIPRVMQALDQVELTAPVQPGQTVLADVCGTGADVVTTRAL